MAEHDSNLLHDVEAALTAAQNERTAAREELKEAWRTKELKPVLRAFGKLLLKKWKVAAKAAVLNLKAISILLKTGKDVIIEACKDSSIFKTAGRGYGSLVAVGNTHQVSFSLSNNINSFQGAGLSDVLFPISLLLLATIFIGSIVVAVLLAILICLPIPWYAERLAGFFRWAFKSTSLKAVLSIGFVIFSVLVSVGWISSSAPEKIVPGSGEILKDKVAIETVPPSEVNGEYLRVNSNSTYMFVQSLDPNNTSVERVPMSQIAYITVNDGEREPGPASAVHALLERNEKEHEALRHGHDAYAMKGHGHKNGDLVDPGDHKHPVPSHEHDTYAPKDHGHSYAAVDHQHDGPNPDHEHPNYITEDLLRTRITEEMACDGGKEAQISGFIRFNKGSAKLGDFDANSKEIESFARDKGQATKWVVFGFASPDGEQGVNNPLSRKRAKTVRKELCTALSSSRPELKCEEDINIKEAGEDYPINGVANSRSARIAVCVNVAPQQSRVETP